MINKLQKRLKNKGNMSFKVGIPHFKGYYKSSKTNNSLKRAVLDIVDNVIFSCKNFIITLDIDSDTLHSIKFSDDYIKGFEKIHSDGSDNPFNMSHRRDGHSAR